VKFHIVTIFPEFFRGPFEHGVVPKARDAGLIEIQVHDLRTWTYDRHKTVDDRPFGGGEGMLLKPAPIFEAVEAVWPERKPGSKVILLSGDRPAEVALFARGMGITEAYGGKSPEEKVEFVRKTTLKNRTLYLGDGINDAPAMMAATAAVALGVNSDITSEAAGAVILQSSLVAVDELMHIGRRMRGIALVSAVGGMSLSLVGMAAAAFGLLSPVQGAISQEVIDLLSILNSLRMILPTGPMSDFKADA